MSASKIAVTEPWWSRNNPENMKDVHSVQEFVDELVRSCAENLAPRRVIATAVS